MNWFVGWIGLMAVVSASKHFVPATWPTVGYVALTVAGVTFAVAAVRMVINR